MKWKVARPKPQRPQGWSWRNRKGNQQYSAHLKTKYEGKTKFQLSFLFCCEMKGSEAKASKTSGAKLEKQKGQPAALFTPQNELRRNNERTNYEGTTKCQWSCVVVTVWKVLRATTSSESLDLLTHYSTLERESTEKTRWQNTKETHLNSLPLSNRTNKS